METDLNFILRHEYLLSGQMRDFVYSTLYPMRDSNIEYTREISEHMYKIKKYIYSQLERQDNRRMYMDMDGNVREVYEDGRESKPVVKVVVKVPKIIKTKINFTTSLGEANHPVSDKLFAQAGDSLRKFEEIVFSHFQDLEEEFPDHTGFYYDLVKEDYSYYYNLMAKEK